MRNHRPPPNSGRDAFTMGSGIVSFIGAMGICFFVAPLLYRTTIATALDFALPHYGPGWEDLIAFFWGLGCAVVVFGASQMLLAMSFRLVVARLTILIFRH